MHLIDILLGKQTDKVVAAGHDRLTVFGIGADLRDAEWRGVVRQLLAQGLLAVESDHDTLALTDASAEVLRGSGQGPDAPRAREGARPARPAAPARPPAAVDMPAEAAPLFERLRAWRAATAQEQGVPAYVIFHDATLRTIAAIRPATLAALGQSTASARTSWRSSANRSSTP